MKIILLVGRELEKILVSASEDSVAAKALGRNYLSKVEFHKLPACS